ncbi:MAG: LysE family translocator [Sulfitobacter litoralis]|jgi:threonine/homoserine/homoserine lactone efflux protein|uniref:LysE family translocator n=2 Tax=root TaxID=1 RepID=A0A1H0V3P7_9RHOB|nr:MULTISPECIES: LysE family translocator [Sulfitobacter]MBQ0766089.1 LysE family translocator [Sulfitobacter litoralis]MBQ0800236.1 LysE family translocator [Sulfitobacter litoralis]MCF7727738.1 LysE family translocator [Sulfitobacter sp. M22]MCF7776217.1 LysE family translocator [Sulfitobacter sp. M220]SDP73169.1 Threonine/homoserine/homoserine lactone efflux protein [Sulfitobacter litoralis]|tara:strand:+ start:2222 stop:2842 length:621 start_codon:yes stop_codon:yes gene_type:complete
MTIALPDLMLYCGALLILFLTPGPVWLAIMARALSGGFGAAWPLAVGVAIGDMLWPLVAVLGISWILSVFDMFMLGMRWIACGVFLIMGFLLIRHADAKIDRDSRLTRPGAWAGFGAGLLAILGNPKAVLFYIGVLPGFFDLRSVTAVDVGAIIAVSVAIPLLGNLAVAALVGKLRGLMSNPATLKRINMMAGVLLICVGLLIPFL